MTCELLFLVWVPNVTVFFFKIVNETEIKDLLRSVDVKKESAIDTIPPNLVKLSAESNKKFF